MRWSVEIQMTSLERRNLSDLLEGLGYELVEGVDYPAIASTVFEEMDSRQDVWSAARELRDAFKGPAEIDSDFALGSVIDYSSVPPKRHAFLEIESVELRLETSSATISVSPPQGLSDDELREWENARTEQEYQAKLENQRSVLEPAFREPKAAKVLELLKASEQSGVSLNKVYELMEGHRKNRKAFQSQFGIDRHDFLRFGDAVHNASVSGDKARHAYKEEPKTTNPMTMHEAELFVRKLAGEWFAAVRSE